MEDGKQSGVILTGEDEEMARHGITRRPESHFLCGGYRYSSLGDALAQATRGQPGADLSGRQEEVMKRYGIVQQSTDCFFYGEFRYTSSQDAIAEARRHPHRGRAVDATMCSDR